MRVLVLADLHGNNWEDAGRDPLEAAEDLLQGLDAVILAGDITDDPELRWAPFLRRVRLAVGLRTPVYAFPGNHDFYRFGLENEVRLHWISRRAGVHYAQKQVIHLGSTRLLCATLWTDFEVGKERLANLEWIPARPTDCDRIRAPESGHGQLCREEIHKLHLDHRAWIESELAKPWGGRTILVTHHAPHEAGLDKDWFHADAYACDLSDLFEGPHAPEMALHGHSHDAADVRVGKTEIRCISLGFPYQLPTAADIRERVARAIIEVG